VSNEGLRDRDFKGLKAFTGLGILKPKGPIKGFKPNPLASRPFFKRPKMGFKPKPQACQPFFKCPNARPKFLKKRSSHPTEITRAVYSIYRPVSSTESKTPVSSSKQLIADLNSGCFSGIPEGRRSKSLDETVEDSCFSDRAVEGPAERTTSANDGATPSPKRLTAPLPPTETPIEPPLSED
jgi:hypothetical protein